MASPAPPTVQPQRRRKGAWQPCQPHQAQRWAVVQSNLPPMPFPLARLAWAEVNRRLRIAAPSKLLCLTQPPIATGLDRATWARLDAEAEAKETAL